MTKLTFFRTALLAMSLCYLLSTPLTFSPALAKEAFSPEQQQRIAEVQTYLNGISTLTASLVQRNPDQTVTSGKIAISRTGKKAYGKLRLEYQPPAKDLVIVDGEELIHYDLSSGDVNRYGIGSTPAAFLLKKRISFTDDFYVKEAKVTSSEVRLTLVNRGDEEGMSLSLVFALKPFLALQEWTVFDGQGNTTHVTLSDLKIGIDLDENKLFRAA
jgi:outer membrane lipoprotein-sorting protein